MKNTPWEHFRIKNFAKLRSKELKEYLYEKISECNNRFNKNATKNVMYWNSRREAFEDVLAFLEVIEKLYQLEKE